MPFGAAIAAVGAIGGAAISARASRKAGRSARAGAEPRLASGDFAGLGVTQITPEGQVVSDPNQFTEFGDQLLAAGGDFLNRGPAFDVGAATGGISGLESNRLRTENAFSNLQTAIGQTPQFDVDAFAAEQFDRLNSLAARGEETAASSLANNLFARGRLGRDDTTTGDAFSALERAQNEARTSRAFTALNLAGTERDRLFREQQQNIANQFQFLGQSAQQQQAGVNQFAGLFGLNSSAELQNINTALGLQQGAINSLQPGFNALTLLQNVRSSDQAARAGVASSAAALQAQSGAQIGNALAGAASGFGQAVFNNRNPAPQAGGTG